MLVHLTSCLESLLRKVFLSAFGTEVSPVVPVLTNTLLGKWNLSGIGLGTRASGQRVVVTQHITCSQRDMPASSEGRTVSPVPVNHGYNSQTVESTSAFLLRKLAVPSVCYSDIQ